MMDDNPNLLQLWALQALADPSGNTLVFGYPTACFLFMPGNKAPLAQPGE